MNKSDQNNNARLEIIRGPFKGEVFILGKDDFSIGRAADNVFVLPDITVSRQHAEIIQKNAKYMVIEKGLNGVKVNGQPVKSRQLYDRDIIEIGPCSFRFIESAIADNSLPPDKTLIH